ncbi:MAG TPA: hypothetical protein PK109_00395 [Candidatus Paceibacterota bacterium]|nr:hypothetical protein [Candidatus Paceibacterota bacterium]
MKNQTLIGIVIIVIVLVAGAYVLTLPASAPTVEQAVEQEGKLKAANFEGTLTEVNMGCAYDAECYAVVDGKHITLLKGRNRDVSGPVDLDVLGANIGKTVEVYVHDLGDGTYTLYGSEGFYVRPKN